MTIFVIRLSFHVILGKEGWNVSDGVAGASQKFLCGRIVHSSTFWVLKDLAGCTFISVEKGEIIGETAFILAQNKSHRVKLLTKMVIAAA